MRYSSARFDVSGMILECCLLNTPIILLGNRQENSGFILPVFRGPKERLDVGPIVEPAQLPKTINEVLTVDSFIARRKYWADKMLGPVDGKSAERVVSAILKEIKN